MLSGLYQPFLLSHLAPRNPSERSLPATPRSRVLRTTSRFLSRSVELDGPITHSILRAQGRGARTRGRGVKWDCDRAIPAGFHARSARTLAVRPARRKVAGTNRECTPTVARIGSFGQWSGAGLCLTRG